MPRLPALPQRLPSRRKRPAAPPEEIVSRIPPGQRMLAAVPITGDGSAWLLACDRALLALSRAGAPAPLPERTGWDRITHVAWDAQERRLSLTLLHDDHPRTVTVPAVLHYHDGHGGARVRTTDEAAFSRALRQRVEAAIVHHVSRTLTGGQRATASVRRTQDGRLYVTLEAPGCEGMSPEDQQACKELLAMASDAVGLPTR